MRKLFLFLSFCVLTGISFVCHGQYAGGSQDGFSAIAYSPSSCSVLSNSNIYFGGVSYNSSDAALSVGVCAAPTNANIYFGGVQDGFSSGTLTVSVCPAPLNANIYFGGVQDGFSSGTLAASVCPVPLNSNIYFGGVEDGFSTAALTASVCPVPLNSNIYFGGVQDGFSDGALTVSVCPVVLNANIYFGGVQDGFSSVYLKTLLATCLLRIELASFTGSCVGGVRVLNWSTATESNNAYFTIEYSDDGQSWQSAGTVAGAGNSSTTIDYSFTDAASHPGLTYYRLQQTDLDGKFTFSSIISVGSCTATGTDKLNIFPNPSPGPFSLTFDGDKTKIQAIEIYNVLGERIYYSGAWQSNIDLSDKPSATYFVHFITDTRTDIKEIVIKKY
jgi:hypothetical protein